MIVGYEIAMTECEKWVKELVEKDVMKMTISEKGYVTISNSFSVRDGVGIESRYEQVMEKSKELEQRINVMQKILTSKRELSVCSTNKAIYNQPFSS